MKPMREISTRNSMKRLRIWTRDSQKHITVEFNMRITKKIMKLTRSFKKLRQRKLKKKSCKKLEKTRKSANLKKKKVKKISRKKIR